MNHARARLWLGITSVGTLVVLAVTALALDLPGRFLPGPDAGFGPETGVRTGQEPTGKIEGQGGDGQDDEGAHAGDSQPQTRARVVHDEDSGGGCRPESSPPTRGRTQDYLVRRPLRFFFVPVFSEDVFFFVAVCLRAAAFRAPCTSS